MAQFGVPLARVWKWTGGSFTTTGTTYSSVCTTLSGESRLPGVAKSPTATEYECAGKGWYLVAAAAKITRTSTVDPDTVYCAGGEYITGPGTIPIPIGPITPSTGVTLDSVHRTLVTSPGEYEVKVRWDNVGQPGSAMLSNCGVTFGYTPLGNAGDPAYAVPLDTDFDQYVLGATGLSTPNDKVTVKQSVDLAGYVPDGYAGIVYAETSDSTTNRDNVEYVVTRLAESGLGPLTGDTHVTLSVYSLAAGGATENVRRVAQAVPYQTEVFMRNIGVIYSTTGFLNANITVLDYFTASELEFTVVKLADN